MGTYLSQPVTEKESCSGAGGKHAWGCSSMQGWRNNMEDAHIAISDLGGEHAGFSLFSVFDGHGGKEVALFCRERFPDEVRRQLSQQGSDLRRANAVGNVLGSALRDGYHAMDEMLRQPEQAAVLSALKQGKDPNSGSDPGSSSGSGDEVGSDVAAGKGAGKARPQVLSHLSESIQSDLASARDKGSLTKEEAKQVIMKMALLKRMSNSGPAPAETPVGSTAADNVGCTAVSILLTPTEVVCANAGDSRAILCRGGVPVELSHDHKPNDDTERTRIEAAGGKVDEIPVANRVIYRINGNLNLSRSIGDLEYKKRADLGPESQVICSTPDLITMPLTDEDEFIVLACDGVWDVKTNEEVCDFVRLRLQQGQQIPDIVEMLLDDCICENPKEAHGLGGDNMTCIVVQLKA